MTAEAPDPARGPLVAASVALPNGVRFRLEVPAELRWFAGHFPGQPLLPGAAQTGWAVALARDHFGFAHDPAAIEQVKFQRPVRPGARLELELVRDPKHPRRIAWRYSEDGEAVGSGRMDFAERAQ